MAFTSKHIFVNLHVKNVKQSMAFFTGLGFEFNMQFTDEEKASCLVIGENMFVMLLTDEYFKSFTKKEVVDTDKYAQLTIALSAESQEKVDKIVNEAVSLGGKLYTDPADHGFMYQWGFQDLGGHNWEIAYGYECGRSVTGRRRRGSLQSENGPIRDRNKEKRLYPVRKRPDLRQEQEEKAVPSQKTTRFATGTRRRGRTQSENGPIRDRNEEKRPYPVRKRSDSRQEQGEKAVPSQKPSRFVTGTGEEAASSQKTDFSLSTQILKMPRSLLRVQRHFKFP